MESKKAKYMQHHEIQKHKILEITKELSLQHGIQTISMVDIAKSCNMTRATLYRYFSSKEEILWAIMYMQLTKFNKLIHTALAQASSTYDRFVRITDVFLHQYESNDEFYLYNEIFQNLYLKESAKEDFQWLNEYNKDEVKPGDLVHNLMENFHDGSVDASLDPKLTSVSFVYTCNYIIHCAYDNQKALPVKYKLQSLDYMQHAMEVQLSYLRPHQP